MRNLALFTLLVLMAAPLTAVAEDAPNCEILVMKTIPDDSGKGEMRVARFLPADDFLTAAHSPEIAPLTKVDDLPIGALMCTRNDILPRVADYPLLATGVPFVLSQDFDSSETDSLTIYWTGAKFETVYKGHPLSDEAQSTLDIRLADFAARDHGLPRRDAAPGKTQKSETQETDE